MRTPRANRIEHINRETYIQNDALTKGLTRIRETGTRMDLAAETMRNERDLMKQMLDAVSQETLGTEQESEALASIILDLKRDVREVDQMCIETHVRQTQQFAAGLSRDAAQMELHIREAEDEVT